MTSSMGRKTGCMPTDKIAVITDSCSDILPELIQEYPIFTIPYTLTFSDGSYRDGVDIFPDEVYRRQVTDMPKTSLPSGAAILDTFRQIKEEGYNKAIAIMLSSGLSGCYQMMRLMAQDCDGLEVAVFDSMSGSLGQGAIVLTLCRLIEAGRSWEQLLALTPRLCKNTYAYFTVDTLEYLQRGGRIGKITAIAGTALGIKPILAFHPETGELTSIYKVRGRAAAMHKLVQVAVSNLQPSKRYNIMWAHGASPEEGEKIAEELRAAAPDFEQEFYGEIDCTLASYVGPHLLGAAVQLLDDDML